MAEDNSDALMFVGEQLEKLRKDSIDPMSRTMLRLSDNIAALLEEIRRARLMMEMK